MSKTARRALEDLDNDLYISSISCYELSYKYRLGKLAGFAEIADNPTYYADLLGAHFVKVSPEHATLAGNLEWDHRDPFDRLLVAQALDEGFALVTSDKVVADVADLKTIW
ncbi:MAG: type II toxin-antitoxin system VapC family toxin [Actinomycetia bacterium]|nr:type II toxin-antitoxin system VapC family toxin [Actinomycetes bacterium]